jgi:hypothetical protein
MRYNMPFDLYEDWKQLYFEKDLLENTVKELKEKTNENHTMRND